MSFELINSTPFVPLTFESVDEKLNHFGVVVAQGTFKISNNCYLELSPEQDTPVLEDTYYGEANSTGLRFDSALSPYKPKTDLIIEATSYSPSGRKEPHWISQVKAGPVSKSFMVTGPRFWSGRPGWEKLSAIEPIDSLPIRYEYAYGGSGLQVDTRRYGSNPIGRGYVVDALTGIRQCPQLLPAGLELRRAEDPIEVIGLGPVAPAWQPRLNKAGTFDAEWTATQAPYLPRDFSYEFYNVAAPGLTFPGFANGDEPIQLLNLSSERLLRFALPGISMITLLEFADGRLIPGPMNLDTIHLLVEERKAILQWRGIFPAHIPMSRVELRMSASEHMVES